MPRGADKNKTNDKAVIFNGDIFYPLDDDDAEVIEEPGGGSEEISGEQEINNPAGNSANTQKRYGDELMIREYRRSFSESGDGEAYEAAVR